MRSISKSVILFLKRCHIINCWIPPLTKNLSILRLYHVNISKTLLWKVKLMISSSAKRWYSWRKGDPPWYLAWWTYNRTHTNTKMQENLLEFFPNLKLLNGAPTSPSRLCEDWWNSEFPTTVFKWNTQVYQSVLFLKRCHAIPPYL